eukprot:6757535-Pyramimonas_sp.AAC.1
MSELFKPAPARNGNGSTCAALYRYATIDFTILEKRLQSEFKLLKHLAQFRNTPAFKQIIPPRTDCNSTADQYSTRSTMHPPLVDVRAFLATCVLVPAAPLAPWEAFDTGPDKHARCGYGGACQIL